MKLIKHETKKHICRKAYQPRLMKAVTSESLIHRNLPISEVLLKEMLVKIEEMA